MYTYSWYVEGGGFSDPFGGRMQQAPDSWGAVGLIWWKMTAVGFEPTQLALVELESTPLDHSGKLS